MSEYKEIAYAAAAGKLCLFTGTGFSKALTGDSAPGWQELLMKTCDILKDGSSLKESLFPDDQKNPLSLEEAAQVISIQLSNEGKDIHSEIAEIIKNITPSEDSNEVFNFLKNQTYKVVTTNYDKLIESVVGDKDCQSITPGLPIPKAQAKAKIYHVHGSIDSPRDMVITSDDYFKFLNFESYFSRKLSTVLHENTIVILGYSLSDTNLKAIISDYKGFSRNHVIGSNIFLVSRSNISQNIKDYYSACYGIRVIDNIQINDFFNKINSLIPSISEKYKDINDYVHGLIHEGQPINVDHIKNEDSFYEIVYSLSSLGVSINDKKVVDMLGKALEEKVKLTTETGAWNQYVHMAGWLCYLASMLEIKDTSIEKIYLNAAQRSMEKSTRNKLLGYSWHAYSMWKEKWMSIISSNRALIKAHILDSTTDPDALDIVG